MVVLELQLVAPMTLIVVVMSVTMECVRWLAEIRMIVHLVKSVHKIFVHFHVPDIVYVQQVKHVLPEVVFWVAEVTKTVRVIRLVSIINVKILVHQMELVVQMLCVIVLITFHHVNVQLDLKVIQYQNRDVFVYQQLVLQQINVLRDICALQINVTYRAQQQHHALSVNVATTMFAQKFVIQIIIAYLVKFVMTLELVNQVVLPMAIVPTHKFVSMQNVNVELDSLEHHSVVLILMNVQRIHVIQVQDVKMVQDHSDVFALKQLLEMHILNLDVDYQINVTRMKNVLIIWLALKVNVRIHVR